MHFFGVHSPGALLLSATRVLCYSRARVRVVECTCVVAGAWWDREIEKEKEWFALSINQGFSQACQIYQTEQWCLNLPPDNYQGEPRHVQYSMVLCKSIYCYTTAFCCCQLSCCIWITSLLLNVVNVLQTGFCFCICSCSFFFSWYNPKLLLLASTCFCFTTNSGHGTNKSTRKTASFHTQTFYRNLGLLEPTNCMQKIT